MNVFKKFPKDQLESKQPQPIYALLLALLLSPLPLFANWDQQVQKLADLRLEVEELSRQLNQQVKSHEQSREVLVQQRVELEGRLVKESLREKLLLAKQSATLNWVKTHQAMSRQERETLRQALAQLSNWAQHSLPDLTQSKAEHLQRLRDRIENQQESFASLALALWDWVDKEIKLSLSQDYRIEPIEWRGQSLNAQVARLGLYTRYAQLPSGEVLYQVPLEGGGWSWQEMRDTHIAKGAKQLISDLKDKKTIGFYPIPLFTSNQKVSQ